MRADDLPRLAYVADVNVQSLCHGSLQLFRLLSDYPLEKLLIVETTWNCSTPERRLPGVAYRHHRPWWSRVFHQRRIPGLAPWLAKRAANRWREIGRQISSFRAEALLTVAHGFSWLGVSELAQHSQLPLHLVIHDDWPRHPSYSPAVSHQLDSIFRTHYRRAASRMCVSASMEESYRAAYDVPGTILYPTRSTDLAVATGPPSRLEHALENLTVAFAGTLHPGQIAPMRTLVEVLGAMQGRLLIFGPMSEAELGEAGLLASHVEFRGMLTPNAMIEAVRQEADLLYTPVSFEEQWRGNASLGFPSKLTDYSAAGLPILIHGPPWSAAVKWARLEPLAAAVVEDDAPESLARALTSLQQNASLRMQLAKGALEAGERYFSAAASIRLFQQSLHSSAVPT